MTGTGPIDAGTVKLAIKNPLVVVFTIAGVVSTVEPLDVIFTVASGSKPIPEIFTEAPTGPEFGLRKMVVNNGDVTVNVFEAELDPWVALTV